MILRSANKHLPQPWEVALMRDAQFRSERFLGWFTFPNLDLRFSYDTRIREFGPLLSPDLKLQDCQFVFLSLCSTDTADIMGAMCLCEGERAQFGTVAEHTPDDEVAPRKKSGTSLTFMFNHDWSSIISFLVLDPWIGKPSEGSHVPRRLQQARCCLT